jgi:hypothetical protein
METISINEITYIGCIFSKIQVGALGTQTTNVNYVETGFIGQTGSIFVRHSAATAAVYRKIIDLVSKVT